jgi:UDP-N-acetylglucosamine 2-epimerase (non-hydrolysing)
MKIISVVGARPNFMKIAPFIEAIERHNRLHSKPIEHLLVHTGQHYDIRMADAFFKALDLPEPDINLQIGSGTHAEQVGNTMIAFEKVLLEHRPDWVVVPGDVNATLACSLAAKKLHIKVCHIEAGLRSNDETMPEEINRIVTDRISDLLLTPDHFANENLKQEGALGEKVVFVGNIMIDSLQKHLEEARSRNIEHVLQQNAITYKEGFTEAYAVITMHRPSNVDDPNILSSLVNYITTQLSRKMPVVWSIHPRTKKNLKAIGLWEKLQEDENVLLLQPLDYHEMVKVLLDSKIVLTDSGGLQEECTVLNKPCVILRPNTERPVTLMENGGAGILTGSDIVKVERAIGYFLTHPIHAQRPELWDGKTAERCLTAILNFQ